MRIALVTREYPPETAWGGIGAYYAGFAKSLSEAGHDVEVFTQGLERGGTSDQDGVRVTRILAHKDGYGPPAEGAMAGSRDVGLFALGLARAMHAAVSRRHAEAPFDLIEGHEHLGINALINADASINAQTVTRYHSAYHTLVRRGLVDWPASPLIEELERLSIAKARIRISTSDVISRAVAEDFSAPQADAVIPNGVYDAGLGVDWDEKAREVLFVGRLVLAHKRPDIAVEAFVTFALAHPDWRMVIIGPDQDHDDHGTVWAYLQTLIPEAIRPRIDYRGAQSQAKVYAAMARSRVILMPSDFESFGMVAVEAMLQGCLPLVSSGTATADVAPDARLVRQRGCVEDFAAGLDDLLGDEERSGAAALSNRLIAHARDAFSQSRMMSDNLALFEHAVSKARRRTRTTSANDRRPLVSVIVPNFNGERFLDETLGSIFSQDYPHIEVILVDGASSDASLQVAARYPDLKIISRPDKGQAHAINRGLLAARGDILAYLNSDDLYRPGAVTAIVEHFRRRPDAMIICGACDYIDEASNVIGKLIQPKFSGVRGIVRYWGWERWHTIPQQACFWRRELTERIGLFDCSLHFVMDLDYWIRAAQNFAIETAPETLAAFRLVAGTKTVSQTDRMYLEEYATFRKYRHILPLPDRWAASWEAGRHASNKLLALGEHLYLTEHLRRRGMEVTLAGMRLWPIRILDVRVWLMLQSLITRKIGLAKFGERVHRRIIYELGRMGGRT